MRNLRNDSDVSLPLVAILMATYNGERWLSEQLDSIFTQLDCRIHIFANDDGSSDETLAILSRHRFAASIHITQDKRGGAGQNFLHLVQITDLTGFDYVAFSDQDDIWMPDKISRAIAQIKMQDADAYSSNVSAFWADGERRLIMKSQPQRKYDYLFESAGPGCTFVFRNNTATAFQAFLRECPVDKLVKVTLHDWLAYGWVRGTGKKWFIDDFSGLDYRQHGNNVLGASRNRMALKKRWQMITDGWYIEQARGNARLIGHENAPARYLCNGGLGNLVRTLLNISQLRRRRSEALFVGFVLLFEFFGLRRVIQE